LDKLIEHEMPNLKYVSLVQFMRLQLGWLHDSITPGTIKRELLADDAAALYKGGKPTLDQVIDYYLRKQAAMHSKTKFWLPR
jgi:hypothetical protein